MNRSIVLAALLVLSFSCKNSEEKIEEVHKRPNIIFIMSDDHAYQAISAYSDNLIATPNIDTFRSREHTPPLN